MKIQLSAYNFETYLNKQIKKVEGLAEISTMYNNSGLIIKIWKKVKRVKKTKIKMNGLACPDSKRPL